LSNYYEEPDAAISGAKPTSGTKSKVQDDDDDYIDDDEDDDGLDDIIAGTTPKSTSQSTSEGKRKADSRGTSSRKGYVCAFFFFPFPYQVTALF
jgi:hypothetical protein